MSLGELRTILVATFSVCGALTIQNARAEDVDLAAEMRAIRGDYRIVVDLNRNIIVEQLLKRWPKELGSAYGVSPDDLAPIASSLRSLSPDRLYSLAIAQSAAELDQALSADAVHREARTKALGSTTSDLTYTPVTPCRIVDTRNGAGGKLAGGDTRNWLASNPGGTFSGQGGSATNCGIPIIPSAVSVNITVANTGGGPAFLTAWPYGQARPTASSLNWVSANSQVANGALIPLCPGPCAADFSVFASSGTDVIIDVVGYFSAPILTSVSSHTLTYSIYLPSGYFNTVGTLGGCLPNEYTVSGSCKASSALVYLTGSYLNATAGWSCDFTNNSALIQLISVQALCISAPASTVP
jgi:hypothetical protein